MYYQPGFHLENCLRVGSNWRNLDFKAGGDMVVKDVTKFQKRHLRVSGCA